jgi:hypothetical protein
MNWKRYQNELIVLIAFVLMFMGYVYKHTQISSQKEAMLKSGATLEEMKEVIALKKIWSDPKTTQKVNKLQTLIPENKMQWSIKSKKVTATYKGLSDNELNTLVTKILNVPIEIKKLQIKNVDAAYDVEFKCQW